MTKSTKSKVEKEAYTFFGPTTSIFLSYLTLLLVLAILVAALFLTRYIYTWWECAANPDISCFDDWYCPGTSYGPGSTGYASSLFGPQSQAALGCDYGVTGSQCALAGAGTCSADSTVPLGCTCAYLAAASTCLQTPCTGSIPGWQPGVAGGCPAASSS